MSNLGNVGKELSDAIYSVVAMRDSMVPLFQAKQKLDMIFAREWDRLAELIDEADDTLDDIKSLAADIRKQAKEASDDDAA